MLLIPGLPNLFEILCQKLVLPLKCEKNMKKNDNGCRFQGY